MSEDVSRSSADGVDPTARRKERGRLAQAAFRRRQIHTIASLRASNQAMQDAIARMARIASGIDNRELAEAARDAQKAAGFDKTDDDSSDEGRPDKGPSASSSAAKTRLTTQVARLGQGAAERQGPAWRSRMPDADEDGSHGAQHAVPSYHRTGRMSPRLDFGLWLEPTLLHVVYPPVDIMPYLQEKKSLSNVLFWASLSYGFKLLQASLLGDMAATRVAWEVFGTIPPLQPDRDVLQGLHARLRFRGAGSLDADHPGNNPDVALRFHEMMVSACEANGTPIDTFLPPPVIETLLRERLGTHYNLLEQGLHDGGDPEVRTMVCEFVGDMVKGSICLGDGPRWTADRATDMLDAFHRRLAPA